MFCPDCNHHLAPLVIPAHNGTVVVDYCTVCGGVWTDHAETNFFELSDLKTIEAVFPKKPKTSLEGHRICPYDRTLLTPFTHESIPTDVRVSHCPKCGGNWFPYHELNRFKKAQKAKLNYFKIWNIPLHSMYAVLLPVLVLGILSVGMIGALTGNRAGTGTTVKASPFIGKPVVVTGKTEATVLFTTKRSFHALLIVTEEKHKKVDEENAVPTTYHSIKIPDLKPGTRYSYQIILTDPETKQIVTSEEFEFVTK